MRAFYSCLLPQGSLVFDLGANVGTMTQVFSSLGAQVVALEPNPDCVRHMELRTSRKSVEVLQAAVSGNNGLAVLRVSDRKDKMSCSLGSEAVSKENRDYVGMWNRDLTVPTTTLDALIKRYGMPFYMKIDVEGPEEQALKGLSRPPALLSFEFNRRFLDSALRAIGSNSLAEALFNYTLIDPCRFELPDWVGQDELAARIRSLPSDGPGLGDIFARHTEQQ